MNDMNLLSKYYYENFDRSKMESITSNYEKFKLTSERFTYPFLGAGTHCSAYQVPLRNIKSAVTEDFSFVISFYALQLGEDLKTDRKVDKFLKCVDLLSQHSMRNNIPLIPPLDSIKYNNQVAIVTPFGNDPIECMSYHWNPIEDMIDQMHKSLREIGLKINDHIQIRTWQGIPFVYDFSDLVEI